MAAFTVQCQNWLILTETIYPATLGIFTTYHFTEKVCLPLLKRFKIWTNHIYNEAPLQAGSKSKPFSEKNEDIIYLFQIFSKYNMEFSRGYMICDATTGYMQKQTQDYSCFLLSQTLEKITTVWLFRLFFPFRKLLF